MSGKASAIAAVTGLLMWVPLRKVCRSLEQALNKVLIYHS